MKKEGSYLNIQKKPSPSFNEEGSQSFKPLAPLKRGAHNQKMVIKYNAKSQDAHSQENHRLRNEIFNGERNGGSYLSIPESVQEKNAEEFLDNKYVRLED